MVGDRRSLAAVASSTDDVGISKSSISSNPVLPSKQVKSKAETLLPIVVLKRNKQSRTFREGNQLVFGGAIAMAYTAPISTAPASAENRPTRNKIAMGSMVRVDVLLQDADGGNSSSSTTTTTTTNSKRGRKTNSNQNYDYQTLNPNAATTPMKPTQTIGWGVYNPNSLYRVRLLCHSLLEPKLHNTLLSISTNPEDDEMSSTMVYLLLHTRLSAALQLRLHSLQLLGNGDRDNYITPPTTDTFRWVNGEGDGLSGLAVDVLGNQVAVIMSSAAWCQVYQTEIEQAVQEVWNQARGDGKDDTGGGDGETLTTIQTVWKTTPGRLEQDGYSTGASKHRAIRSDNEEEEDVEEEVDDEEDDTMIESAASPHNGVMEETSPVVVCRENGILYQTKPFQLGQKTGVYCDQRENRLMIAQYCKGKRVLDLCCYHGGFALHALLLGGASHVTGVDSSQDAIDTCWNNARLNGIDMDEGTTGRHLQFVRDDISNFCKGDTDMYYDVVILDPPKLAPSVASLDKARRKYHSLNRDAIQRIDPLQGGLLLTCTCSAAMTQSLGGRTFLETVQQAATSAGRHVTLLRVSGAASCHTQSPACFPAGDYLTAALFHVAPKQ